MLPDSGLMLRILRGEFDTAYCSSGLMSTILSVSGLMSRILPSSGLISRILADTAGFGLMSGILPVLAL